MTMNAYVEQYPVLSPILPGQSLPWLSARRQAALAEFAANGFPSPRAEEWKYTNVAPIEKKRFNPTPKAADADIETAGRALQAHRLTDAWSLVLVDGRFEPGLSVLDGVPAGVFIGGIADALQRHPQRVEAVFGAALKESHGFIAFNTAFFTDGVFIDIPRGVALPKPIQILHVVTGDDRLATTRSIVALGDNAQATVIETYVGDAQKAYLTAAVTEAIVGANAGLGFYRLQAESDRAFHFGGLYVSQQRDSRFAQHNFAFGALLARHDIHTSLNSGAECVMNGLFLAKGRQHVDNHTLIEHLEHHGVSSETYRGVLADRARGVFQGRIVVHPGAQKTQAEMNNRNLLLSDDAEVDTKPQLEILADDVKCAHGVTIGQLDPESVFYLQSRGVDAESARNMLSFAFANDMVDRIGLDDLKSLVQRQLLDLFPQSGIRRDWL